MDHPFSPDSASSARRRAWVLAAVCMAAVALPLSFSGGAVATPRSAATCTAGRSR